MAIRLAAMQGLEKPTISAIAISVFAADHGIAAEGVSAYPQSVTAQMIANFLAGGAAISVAAKHLGAELEIVNLGTVEPLTDDIINLANHSDATLHQAIISAGTRNFQTQAAMSQAQLTKALLVGKEAAQRIFDAKADIFVGGEMGIGNTTTATALASALLKRQVSDLVGSGTGVDQAGIELKIEKINSAITFHKDRLNGPLDMLRCLGGYEIAALCGAYIRCAQLGLPILVDGFICSVAALFAKAILKGVDEWMIFAHQSVEPGHVIVLEAMEAQPLLNLSMRLGEGSGAAVAIPLLKMACQLHGQMATFAEAGVSDADKE